VPEPVILVVDDEPRVLVRCKAILERASYISALEQGVNRLILKPFSITAQGSEKSGQVA